MRSRIQHQHSSSPYISAIGSHQRPNSLWRRAIKSGLHLRGHLMLGAVGAQFILGVMTLLYSVPVSLGTLHQAGAATLLVLMIAVSHGLMLKKKSSS